MELYIIALIVSVAAVPLPLWLILMELERIRKILEGEKKIKIEHSR